MNKNVIMVIKKIKKISLTFNPPFRKHTHTWTMKYKKKIKKKTTKKKKNIGKPQKPNKKKKRKITPKKEYYSHEYTRYFGFRLENVTWYVKQSRPKSVQYIDRHITVLY